MPKVIGKMLIFGDSLSDRRTMIKSVLPPVMGPEGKSEEAHFVNAYVWFDYALRSLLGHGQLFGDDKVMGTREVPNLARMYCAAGATASNYKKILSWRECSPLQASHGIVDNAAIVLEAVADPFEAPVLHNLEELRGACFQDDYTLNITPEEKEETLVIGWLGANDLVTTNQPTVEAAYFAVNACIQHIKAMISKGYKHFVWFNLPGLELTPRFQESSDDLRDAVKESVDVFNDDLQGEMSLLRAENPTCTFQLLDAHMHFQNMYTNLSQYGFDEAKKTKIYTESAAFKREGAKAVDAGYLFWDRLHPTRRVHELLAGFFKGLFDRNYMLELRQEDHVHQFREAYDARLMQDKARRCMIRSGINYKKEDLGLNEIIQHGLFGEPVRSYTGARTRSVMQQLWMNESNMPHSKYPLIQKFFPAQTGVGAVLPTINELDESVDSGDKNSFDSVHF